MKNKSEALDKFKEFRSKFERLLDLKIAILRVDNAPEYVEGSFERFCLEAGISYEKIVPGAPPQNGMAERSMLTLASMARAMLIDADLPDYFWPFAILCAIHIKCRVPHSGLAANETPFFHVFHRLPNLSYFQ